MLIVSSRASMSVERDGRLRVPSDCTRYPPHTTPIAVGLQASPNPGEPPVPIIRNVISYNLVDKNLPACGEFKQGVIAATNAA